ncbi:hypothetical protein FGSG_03765 [Fusarium graminearum PH-1]|uniref:Chromosome 2, complete genome n=1 Tax=Gibberella zeae (strain ATCC MYA-4620 / CBS 123657 / FGSC 9075 / NRRL 31084 / PH-1) TaxID=229533 RepID=I1RIW8_GIBZE|nr:hypothetical protein FGSG_03765 [Fusarium graminearum PH-1]ESU09423.1 hypothetical protein FGSG_03765 [Fusarium graminearum PH-1]CAF3660691.1 unnamed protein product [Fusarium graminearum]CEF78631.1 unnamed protein product [Fusarium graminearum]|eukprot:XP_011321922.1 hypothetical protein FGSG_03765 [Fusarium graminearum PH-1]
MPPPALDHLPPEIFVAISDLLPWTDKESLSIVNKTLRNQLVPHLFRHLKVNCPLARENNLQSVIQLHGAYTVSVRVNVEFQPNPPNSGLEGTEVDPDSTEAWYWDDYPASVWARDSVDISTMQDVIQFKGMPKCTNLSIHTNGEEDFEIDGGWDENDLADTSIYFCSSPESWEKVKEKEKQYKWRKAWCELWKDVAKYAKTESLELLHFLPIKASCWLDPEWVAFLGRLKSLTIRAYGQDNGAGWAVNTLEGFNAFFVEMPDFLFRHAKNLEHLCIAGNEDGHLGEDALRFEPNTMPQLKSLRLETMSITKSLKEFLSGSTPKLESLYLFNVAAWAEGTEPTWADFWKAVRKGNPALREVVYRYSRIAPLCEFEDMNDDSDSAEMDSDEVAQARKKLTDDPTLAIWPYVTSNDKYGDVQAWEDVNLESLQKGDDNKEYKLLMDEIKQRQQRTIS